MQLAAVPVHEDDDDPGGGEAVPQLDRPQCRLAVREIVFAVNMRINTPAQAWRIYYSSINEY